MRQRALAVDRIAEGVDDPPQPSGGWTDGGGGVDDADICTGRYTLDRPEGHQQGLGVAETDDFGRQRGHAASPLDLGAGADGEAREAAAALDQQAVNAGDLAGHDQRVDRFDGGDEIAQTGPPNRDPRMRERG
jgi:hypothetical protein